MITLHYPIEKWTPPRYAGDHLPKGLYLLSYRRVHPMDTDVCVKLGHSRFFEVGGTFRFPNKKRWARRVWFRFTSNKQEPLR